MRNQTRIHCQRRHNQVNPQIRVSTQTKMNKLLNKQQPTLCKDRSIKSTSCHDPNYDHMTRGIRASQGMLKGETRKRKREDEINSSEGVQINVNEDNHISTPESLVPDKSLIGIIPRSTAPSLQLDAYTTLVE